nr:DUF2147 domain-containing protein [Rhizobium leguminosarum]
MHCYWHCVGLTDTTVRYAQTSLRANLVANGRYSGKITDPDAKRTYDGVTSVCGNTVAMKGSVMKVFCQSKVWVAPVIWMTIEFIPPTLHVAMTPLTRA